MTTSNTLYYLWDGNIFWAFNDFLEGALTCKLLPNRFLVIIKALKIFADTKPLQKRNEFLFQITLLLTELKINMLFESVGSYEINFTINFIKIMHWPNA